MGKPKKRHRDLYVRISADAYFAACVCTDDGRPVKRNGKRITCGHKHRTRLAASRCVERMKRRKNILCRTVEVVTVDISE